MNNHSLSAEDTETVFNSPLSRESVDLVKGTLSLLSANAEDRKDQYWISGGRDAGLSFCDCCVDEAVSREKVANPEGADTIFKDGGWRTENDTLQFCETCNCPLDASLTDYGAEQELDHFSDRLSQISVISEMDPNEAYELDEAISVLDHCKSDHDAYATLHGVLKQVLNLLPNQAA